MHIRLTVLAILFSLLGCGSDGEEEKVPTIPESATLFESDLERISSHAHAENVPAELTKAQLRELEFKVANEKVELLEANLEQAISLGEDPESTGMLMLSNAVHAAKLVREKTYKAILRLHPVQASGHKLERVKDILQRINVQVVYADKLMLKECMVEAFQLEKNLLELNYADKFPYEMRKNVGRILREEKQARQHCRDIVLAHRVKNRLLKNWKRLYLSSQPWTLAEVYELQQACEAICEGVRFLEARHDTVHSVIEWNFNVQVNNGIPKREAAKLWIESHPYWSRLDFRQIPPGDKLLQGIYAKYRDNASLLNVQLFVLSHLIPDEERKNLAKFESELQKQFEIDTYIIDNLRADLRELNKTIPGQFTEKLPAIGEINSQLIFDSIKSDSPATSWHNAGYYDGEASNIAESIFDISTENYRDIASHLGYSIASKNENALLTSDVNLMDGISTKNIDRTLLKFLQASLSPPPAKTEYVKQLDDDIMLLREWIDEGEVKRRQDTTASE